MTRTNVDEWLSATTVLELLAMGAQQILKSTLREKDVLEQNPLACLVSMT